MRRLAAGTFLQWWDTGGNRVQGGDWFPTHYAYVDGEPREGFAIQWLVVGPGPVARFQDREIRLEPVPPGCAIKGAEGLQGPCYARAQYKKMYR